MLRVAAMEGPGWKFSVVAHSQLSAGSAHASGLPTDVAPSTQGNAIQVAPAPIFFKYRIYLASLNAASHY